MALGSYLFYAQHNFPSARLDEGSAWDYATAALAGSSNIPMGPLMRWFTGNIAYHHVHHLNARIPFYRLPEAMAGLEELQSPGVTTLSPKGIYHCLRLKLWDADRQHLVNFAGL
jgi:omega-6 fatty acid desaturase (delta-12 desaturase)